MGSNPIRGTKYIWLTRIIFCNDESLIHILQVCHIKGIMSFDKTAKLKEVNDLKNLVWMCPNHHALFDKGLIKLDESLV